MDKCPRVQDSGFKGKSARLAAKKKIAELCEEDFGDGCNLVLKCHGLGKYGRVLGEIFNHNTSVNRMMVTTEMQKTTLHNHQKVNYI